jgi:hypothetical protein
MVLLSKVPENVHGNSREDESVGDVDDSMGYLMGEMGSLQAFW